MTGQATAGALPGYPRTRLPPGGRSLRYGFCWVSYSPQMARRSRTSFSGRRGPCIHGMVRDYEALEGVKREISPEDPFVELQLSSSDVVAVGGICNPETPSKHRRTSPTLGRSLGRGFQHRCNISHSASANPPPRVGWMPFNTIETILNSPCL